MDISDMKQEARALEQQGNADEALAMYQLILAELDAIGGIRQELPLLIKIGDLQQKTGDVDGAVEMYERAATEYAAQGAAQPVKSLCGKIVRADSQSVGAYLRLSRKLLESGHTEGARQLLMDYAQRAKLDKTREGLEKLSGHAEANQKIVLSKAIDAAEERIPKRIPWARRPAAAKQAEEEEGEEAAASDQAAPPSPTGGPGKRLTVPVGALDADTEPSLLEQHPPEPKKPEVIPEAAFPTAADLQAPVLPETPVVAVPTPALPTPESIVTPLPPVMPTSATVEPPRIDSMPPLPEVAPPLPQTPGSSTSPPLRVSQELMIDTSYTPPPVAPLPPAPPPFAPAPEPRHEPPPPSRPPRISRPQQAMPAPPPRRRRAPRWPWPLIGTAVVAGGVGALIWFKIIPLDRLRALLPKPEPEPVEVRTPPRRPVPPPTDTVMARDTATAPVAVTPSPVLEPPPAAPLVPPPLPAGVVLTGVVYVVSGLPVESVEEFSQDNRLGFRILQILATGHPIILLEFPADPGIEGEIGVTGLPGDTVVGHVRIGGVDVTLKGVIPETQAVELLQQLVQVRP